VVLGCLQAMARLWRVAHFVLSDFLALPLDEMPAGRTAYPPGIPPNAPSALTASLPVSREEPVGALRTCLVGLLNAVIADMTHAWLICDSQELSSYQSKSV
jgi:hypothetical protein